MKDPLGSSLPTASSAVDIHSLQRVFRNTTTSYKFLWFLSILDLVKERGPEKNGSLRLPTTEIFARMVAKAWIPTQRFKLSFGKLDRITEIIEALKNPENGFPFDPKYKESEALVALETLAAGEPEKFKKIISSRLERYVTYRFLSVWFPKTVESIKEAVRFNSVRNPYYFPDNNSSCIEIPPEWREYFEENYTLLKDFTYWNFADFLQLKNTAVPALTRKFELPEGRVNLERQRHFWLPFIRSSHLSRDIYGETFDPENFALDHFLPWTFVVHNQIWNLTPMDRGPNSSKSDLIPQEAFIPPLALQHKNLIQFHLSRNTEASKEFFAEYENFLGIEIADFLCAPDAQIIEIFREHLGPLQQTALNMGFSLWQ